MGKAKLKVFICWVLAALFVVAGILHFKAVESFASIVPPFLPFPDRIVQLTGAMELAFAAGLVWPKWRRWAGILLGWYLLAVLPANIYMAIADMSFGGKDLSAFLLWLRVFLQFPLIALVLWASGYWRASKSRAEV